MYHKLFRITLLHTAFALILAACSAQAPSDSVTLRLAVADAENRPSDPYVRDFIKQVKTLSNGNITIEPIWNAGDDTTPVFEQVVVKVVKEGQYELGFAASRAFDSQSIAGFQALQAPFLITNDALAEAVAESDVATRMLDRMSSSELVGLTLWPEDLRHPFSVVPDKPILSPEDFEGSMVRVVPSEVSHLLIETLGGSPMFGEEGYQAAESGLRQGFSLNGTPTATGNVIFFPKFQVLFANGAAFEKLSQTQRTVLREAARATQEKAIAEHPREVEAAAAWCADGGSIVLASEEQVAAFEAAAQPVFNKIEADSFNTELIAAIRELKAKTEPSPGASACAPQVELVPTTTISTNSTWTDEFNGSLSPEWSWMDEDPTHWNLNNLPGALQIITQGESLYWETKPKNLLLRDAPTSDFEIMTKLTFDPLHDFQQAGILIYQDEDNFIMLNRGFCSFCVGNGIHLDKEVNGETNFDDLGPHTAISLKTTWLKLQKTGTTYVGFYSADGKVWNQLGQVQSPMTPTKVGLIANNANADPTVSQIPADYDFFTLIETSLH